jgi:von Willebrand factor type A domain
VHLLSPSFKRSTTPSSVLLHRSSNMTARCCTCILHCPLSFAVGSAHFPIGCNTTSHSRRDLVFVQDCTGSQGSYISSATKNIQLICENIFQSGKLQSREDLRVGLVAYRDHPPQDHTYVTRNFGFSSDIDKVHRDLSSLYASGGGDGPEAVTAGLAEALKMDWREQASKMIVLIADAPPHGIGEYGDGACVFFEGDPALTFIAIRVRRWIPRRQ